ncbi:MAG: hypothetical protein IEMM0002_1525 [bacterium]|nr:MAG: hypothetical protein IEMM0002_1525 [bacterium]
MKCPKCAYVSFEYLNSCRKCGVDLTAHKAELGIDFPQYYDLGLLTPLDETAPAASQDAVGGAVAVEEGSEAAGENIDLAAIDGLVAEVGQTAEESEPGPVLLDEAVNDENGGLDLSSIDEAAEETSDVEIALKSGDETQQEKTPQAAETAAEDTSPGLSTDEALEGFGSIDEISLDLGDVEAVIETGTPEEKPEVLDSAQTETEEKTVAEENGTDEISLDLGDLEFTAESGTPEEKPEVLDSAQTETEEKTVAEENGTDEISLDLGDVEATAESGTPEEKPEVLESELSDDPGNVETAEEPAQEIEKKVESSDGIGDLDFDLDIGIDDDETPEPASKEGQTEDSGDTAVSDELNFSLDDVDLDIDFESEELMDGDEERQEGEKKSKDDEFDLEDLKFDE